MYGLYLACCLRALQVSHHFTPELGATIAAMIGVAVLVAAFAFVISPAVLPKRA